MRKLTLGSLFDGIGGWQLAAQHAGIKPLWRCEIDEYPRAVSEYHFPGVDSYGDICKIHGNEIAPVDIICAGSPCQNLSLAGNRKGLQGNESSLFYESIRILKEMRDATNGKYPRFFVWENVVGAFSSNHGNDFRAVLSEIGQTKIPMPQSGRWATCGMVRVSLCDIAWRTLDAQYWGVPQRRRRIFLVADFATEGRCAAEILFVEQGVCWNTQPRQEKDRKTASTNTQGGIGETGAPMTWCITGNVIGRKNGNGGHQLGVDCDVSYTLSTVDHRVVYAETYTSRRSDNIVKSSLAGCLAARDYKGVQSFVNYPEDHETDARTVRYLTVTECERLQGLPDGWTDVTMNGHPACESKRLKAIGNGMAQPCADFVLSQLAYWDGKKGA